MGTFPESKTMRKSTIKHARVKTAEEKLMRILVGIDVSIAKEHSLPLTQLI